MSDNANGAGQKAHKVSQLVLTLDHETMTLNITGSIANDLTAVAILEMGRMEMEGRYRAAQMRQSLAIAPGGTLDFGKRFS